MIVKDFILSLNTFPNKNTYTTLSDCILQGFLIVFLNFPDVGAILVIALYTGEQEVRPYNYFVYK